MHITNVLIITFRFGHVFMAETGTSVGEISGQSKPINSCDFRPARPFRLITGSEDNTIAVFEGPPFKFKYVHIKFICFARFSFTLYISKIRILSLSLLILSAVY